MKKLALILVIAIMLSMIVSCTISNESNINSNGTSSYEEVSENSNDSSTESEISEDSDDETSDDDITEDGFFVFKVKDDMPEYKVEVKVDEDNNSVTEITLSEKDAGKVVQKIDLSGSNLTSDNDIFTKSVIYFEDITFDGTVDILLPYAKSNRSFYFIAYIWNESEEQFVLLPEFNELGNIVIDSENKRILTHNSIWLDEGRNADFYSILSFDGERFITEKQFSLTPSEDLSKMNFKETSGDGDDQTTITEFELELDNNLSFDKTGEKIKPYYETDSPWDLSSDKWRSDFINEFK